MKVSLSFHLKPLAAILYLYRCRKPIRMKCVHCSRELYFSTRTDRTSGLPVDVYRCVYCGTEMKEYRFNRQVVRS